MNLKEAYKRAEDAQDRIDRYVLEHSDAEPEYLRHIVREAHLQMINPRMMSGHLQGRLLKMLVEMVAPKRVLEIGTFAGYSALCMAEGLREGAELHTVEIDDELEDFIRGQFGSVAHGEKITLHIGDAMECIPQIGGEFDLVFVDADKRMYWQYLELVLPMMPVGGIILADNTLWDGKVLVEMPQAKDHQTIAIKEFNDRVARDVRVERVMLPVRDGMTIIRKL